jgi:hypothetical protein
MLINAMTTSISTSVKAHRALVISLRKPDLGAKSLIEFSGYPLVIHRPEKAKPGFLLKKAPEPLPGGRDGRVPPADPAAHRLS